jgi:hypothetical protein
VLTDMISAPPAASGMAVSASGELFVGQDTDAGDILRFKSILGTPAPNGMFSSAERHHLLGLTFVDDELWTMSTAFRACTADPAAIVRYTFDAAGVASPAGTVATGLIGAKRGILWDPISRMLFVTQCESFRAKASASPSSSPASPLPPTPAPKRPPPPNPTAANHAAVVSLRRASQAGSARRRQHLPKRIRPRLSSRGEGPWEGPSGPFHAHIVSSGSVPS